MKIVVCKDYDDVSRVMAEKVVEQIRKKPNLVFCLPAGNSPIGMYKYLVQMYKEGKADFSQLRTFDMDEYAGLTPDDSHSFIYFMHQHFLDHVNINMDNVRYPKADAADLDAECKQYAQEIIDAGGLDIAITSIGDDGHIAFNEPGEYLLPRTHVVKMDEATRQQNAKAFADCAGKLLHKLFENEKLDPKFPVSWLRMHPDVEFIIDEATAAEIQEDALEYYREK